MLPSRVLTPVRSVVPPASAHTRILFPVVIAVMLDRSNMLPTPLDCRNGNVVVPSYDVANGNVNVDGGTITRDASGNFNLASGKTLTATNGALIDFTGKFTIDDGTTFDILSGADLSTNSELNIGNGSGDGTLVVDGLGSSLSAPINFWGTSGDTADVTFRNGATGDLSGIALAFGLSAGLRVSSV